MKKFSKADIDQVKEYAKDLLTWKDIAYLMGIDVDDFKDEFLRKKSDLYIAYQTGVAERKLALRKPVLKMAEHGSPQAEIIAVKLLQEQKVSELID